MFVALSDLSTYDTNGYFVSLTPAGMDELEATNDLQSVSVHNYEAKIPIADLIDAYNALHGKVKIPIADLIAAYNELHGTDY